MAGTLIDGTRIARDLLDATTERSLEFVTTRGRQPCLATVLPIWWQFANSWRSCVPLPLMGLQTIRNLSALWAAPSARPAPRPAWQRWPWH